MELEFKDLENVVGGISIDNSDPICFCKKCGQKLKFLKQTKIEGGNTGIYRCENANVNGTGKRCPDYMVEKTNNEVVFGA